MTTDLVVAHEEDALIDLMRTMHSKGVKRVPVVGQQNELIGIVTFDDVLGLLSEELDLLVATVGSERQRESVCEPDRRPGVWHGWMPTAPRAERRPNGTARRYRCASFT